MSASIDAQGRNVFASENPRGSASMQHAAAGLLATMADGMALFAPLANSWRRFRAEAYVPLTADWAINNRGAALRVPVSNAANRRAGAPGCRRRRQSIPGHGWMLGGILKGLEKRAIRARPDRKCVSQSQAPRASTACVLARRRWTRFERSEFAKQLLRRQTASPVRAREATRAG